MQTPLGPTQRVLIRGVSLFQGLFYRRKICLGPHAVSALQWMFLFQRGGNKVGFHCINNITVYYSKLDKQFVDIMYIYVHLPQSVRSLPVLTTSFNAILIVSIYQMLL